MIFLALTFNLYSFITKNRPKTAKNDPRQQYSFSTRVTFLSLIFFYIQNTGTKILTKIIRRAYGSRNLHFLLYIASRVLDAPTVLIQYTSYIFSLLNIFLHSKFCYQNIHKINWEGWCKPKIVIPAFISKCLRLFS